MSAPALPWGRANTDVPKTPEPKAQLPATRLGLQDVGLQVQSRLEVRWLLHLADGAEQEKWWGASVCAAPEGAPTSTTHHILYDACDITESEPETSTIMFTSMHTLYDTEKQSELYWRAAGDPWEPEECSDDDDEAGMEGSTPCQLPESVTAGQIMQYFDQHSSEVEASEASLLSKLTPFQRMQAAAGARDFADQFREFLQAKFSGQVDGESKEVTEEDVRTFAAQLQQKRMRTA
ncbi:hypothetical protein V8C86DRAFT_2492779 [Haematococcus lacustris]